MNSLRIKLSIVFLLTINLMTAWAATSTGELLKLAPENSLLVMACSDADSLKADFEKTLLSKMVSDPQVKTFVEQMKSSLQVSNQQANAFISSVPMLVQPLKQSGLLKDAKVVGIAYDGLDIENKIVNGCVYMILPGGAEKRQQLQNMVQSYSFMAGMTNMPEAIEMQGKGDGVLYDFDKVKAAISGSDNYTFITIGMTENAAKYAASLCKVSKTMASLKRPGFTTVFDKLTKNTNDIKVAINTPLIIAALENFMELPEVKAKIAEEPEEAKVMRTLLDIISPLGEIGTRIGFNDTQIEMETVCENFGDIIIADCVKPVDKTLLKAVSSDSSTFNLTNFDLPKIIANIKSIMLDCGGQEAIDDITNGLEKTKTEIGVDIRNNIINNLTGEMLVSSNVDQSGGLMGSSGFAIIGVKDCDLLIKSIEQLLEIAQSKATQDFRINTSKSEYNGFEITNVVIAQLSMLGMQPGYAKIDDNFIMIASNMSEAIKFTQLYSAKDTSGSILANPKYIAAVKTCPEDAYAITYVNTSKSWNTLNGQLSAFWPIATMGLSQEGIVLPPMIPNVSYLMTDAPATISWSVNTNDDLYFYKKGIAINTSISNANTGSAALMVSILMPALSRAKTLAKATVCSSNLKGIGVATAIYMNDNKGKAPDTLEELMDYDLTEKTLQCPLNDEPGYVWCGKGLHDSCSSECVLAYCDSHQGHDLGYNVLFLDWHVAKIDEEDFAEVMTRNNELRKNEGLEPIDY